MFRFTIRDVLWLTVVVGMAFGWWTQFQDAEKCRSQLSDVERWQSQIRAQCDKNGIFIWEQTPRRGPKLLMPDKSQYSN